MEAETLTVEDVTKMKVSELNDELDARGLEKTGLKADKAQRLIEYIENAQSKSEPVAVEVEASNEDNAMETEEEESKPVATEVPSNEVTVSEEETTQVPMSEETTQVPMSEETTQAPTSDEPKKEHTPIDLSNVFPVWVGDLPEKATEEEITEFFEATGHKVASVKLTKPRRGGRHAGHQFCFVNFETHEGQQHAETLNGAEFQGKAIQVSPRDKTGQNKLFLGRLETVNSEEELTAELAQLGSWAITKVQFKEGRNWAFVFFENADETNQFYDDMKGKQIKGSAVNIEFPRSKEEREAIRQGASKLEIEKVKRTVYLSDLHSETSEQQVREFVETNEAGKVVDIKKPTAKKDRAIMFVEFERKTDADRFIIKFGTKENGELNGEPFLAELSRARGSRPKRNYGGNGRGGRRGYGGRGGWGQQQGYGGYGGGYNNFGGPYGGMPYGYSHQMAGAYGGYGGGYGQPYGGGAYGGGYGGGAYGGKPRGRGRGGRSYKPY